LEQAVLREDSGPMRSAFGQLDLDPRNLPLLSEIMRGGSGRRHRRPATAKVARLLAWSAHNGMQSVPVVLTSVL
jgi:hypothetical protein